MRYWDGQLDMPHPFTTDFLLGHFHTATVADDAFITDSLIFSAMALVILGRPEDTLAEKTVAFRLVCPVVNGFRLQDFSGRPFIDFFWRRQADADLSEIAFDFIIFFHLCSNCPKNCYRYY